MSCFRELINVRQFCVVQDCMDSLQGICLPDPLQLHLQGTNRGTAVSKGCKSSDPDPERAPEGSNSTGAEEMQGVKEHEPNLGPRMGGRTRGKCDLTIKPSPSLCVLPHVQSLTLYWQTGDVQSKPSQEEREGAAQRVPWSLSRSHPKCSWSKHPISKLTPCFADNPV